MTFKKGYIPWNKGKKCLKITESLKEYYETDKGKIKRIDHSLNLKGDKNPSKRKEVRNKLKKNQWTKSGKWSVIEIKKKLGGNNKGKTYVQIHGKKESKRLINNLKIKMIGKRTGDKNSSKRPEVKEKIRKSMIKHIEKYRGKYRPNIGKNEKILLDGFELSNNLKIERQYEVLGYFVDGYNKYLNIVIEIDEKIKNKIRDKIREKEIKNKLNCQFIRIKDY